MLNATINHLVERVALTITVPFHAQNITLSMYNPITSCFPPHLIERVALAPLQLLLRARQPVVQRQDLVRLVLHVQRQLRTDGFRQLAAPVFGEYGR